MDAPENSTESFYWNSQSTPERQGKDHFVVEDLLDFPNEEDDDEDDDNGVGAGDDACVEEATGNSTDSTNFTAVNSCNSSFGEHLAHIGDLCKPYDELAELEWLSNFVEESFSSEDLGKRLQLISDVQSPSRSSEATRVPVQSSDEVIEPRPADHFLQEAPSVPAKARSKRPRAAPCDWSGSLLVLPAPNAAAASSPSSSDSIAINTPKKPPKPSKKKRELDCGVGPALAPSDGRRCLHCATDKTPQWRAGPVGPKTLCNACGVRYKSGRLVPEYRPASSPTFVLARHSNSHRKVLELRRQKEMELLEILF